MTNVSGIEQVRDVLFGAERDALDRLHAQVDQLALLPAAIESNAEALERLEPVPDTLDAVSEQLENLRIALSSLTSQVASLEELVGTERARTSAVGEVLVDAVTLDERQVGPLGEALKPEVEHALHHSARSDSAVLAEALYPVMGPAIRKMIAELFTLGDSSKADSFIVNEILLLERSSGVLLAASTEQGNSAESDIVSGMLDAIRMFVEDAFDSQEHDGLRDLRVGEISVLVEWGPKALLASVIKGVPTDAYRHAAAETLEQIHLTHASSLDDFDGRVEQFNGTVNSLDVLRQGAQPTTNIAKKHPVLTGLAVLVLVICLVLLLLAVL